MSEDRRERLHKEIEQYIPNHNFDRIDKAIDIATKAHASQFRKSGEPYIIHPLEVAIMLAEMEMDEATIIAGILHDVVEDTDYTLSMVKEEFGDEVGNLVDGVTKLTRIPFKSTKNYHAENMRKMFLSMAKDIRVIVIKLNDRLHNMRTLEYVSREKQINKSKETLEIYAPLAHRLGMIKIKWELEDLCLRYLEPELHKDLSKQVAEIFKEKETFIQQIMDIIKGKTDELNMKVYIDGRPKHIFSIYKKMKQQNKNLDQIYDLFAIRIIVDTVNDCYAVLGIVHDLFKPMPGRFKDYIAMPKPNMYQSLHNTLIGPDGVPFEVQIRTWAMHKVAETGIASHWKYKTGEENDPSLEKRFSWIRQLFEVQKDMTDADEFMEAFKMDLFTDEVFVFTPKGDVISLPAGSTPIDFAYTIHSEIGNKMMGAKVNGEIKPLDYKLQNGDIVNVITSSAVNGPSRDWLKVVKSSQAKNKINQWFKKEMRVQNIEKGHDMLESQIKKLGLTWSDMMKQEWVEPILKRYNYSSLDDLLSAIGYGALTTNKVMNKIKDVYKKNTKPQDWPDSFTDKKILNLESVKAEEKKKKYNDSGIVVKGIDNCLVRLSKCCNPVPGDSIVGYITRGRGVSVHRSDCINIVTGVDDDERLIEVSWLNNRSESYPADVIVIAHDRNSLLMEIVNLLNDAKLSVRAVNAKVNKDGNAVININIEIHDTDQLNSILKKFRKIPDVIEANRIRN